MNEKLSFAEILEKSQTNLSSGGILTLGDIFLALAVSLMCVSVIALVYRISFQGVLYQRSYAIALVLTGLITTSVIMAIAGNLALSLGMVGALSIIRFRTAVKDPMDVIYMFWVVTIGIANGVAYFNLSVTATLIISIIMIAATRNRMLNKRADILMIRNEGANADIREMNKRIGSLASRYKLKSHSIHGEGMSETIYEVWDLNVEKLQDSIVDLKVKDITISAYGANS